MCGIAVIVGEVKDQTALQGMMNALAARGEVDEVRFEPGICAGTRRLPIVDRESAVQPWLSADGRWLLCFNGEIFNHNELRAELAASGAQLRTRSDTEVLAEAFSAWGADAVQRLRGEFAFVAVERGTGRTYLARDFLGVKSLYWSRHSGALYVASEIKALAGSADAVREVPPGHHGWAEAGGVPELRAYCDLRRLGQDEPVIEDVEEAAALVRSTLEDSIRVRVDTDLPVGVILSGGLDSTLTLLHVARMHPDCVAFTVGAPGSEDLAYARRLTADLGVRHEVIGLRPRDLGLAQAREAIRICELTEYGDIINAMVSVPLFRRVRECGVKLVLTGDGSDELFGGYSMYHDVSPEVARDLFLHKLRNLGRTELQRVDRASMGAGVEARVPFLDPAMVRLAMRIPISMKLRDGQEKWIVRHAFADLLPDYIRQRPKNPMSHSSGLHERARLYKPLFPRIHRSYGYHVHEPVRRDFSSVLARHGLDVERAVTARAVAGDYTFLEHARDLAGALRRNLVPSR